MSDHPTVKVRAIKWPKLCFAAISNVVFFCGCSLLFPHPEQSSNVIGDADTPQDGRCSLNVAQLRKSLPIQGNAAGIATALIIHVSSSGTTGRSIGSGQSVYFEVSSSTAASASLGHSPPWQIDGVDQKGATALAGTKLMSGNLVTLRDPHAPDYLALGTNAEKRVGFGAASRLMIYKGDVPDATRPTTCDEQIRDQDFVFVRVVAPNGWVTVSDTGVLNVRTESAALVGRTPSPEADRSPCPREEERCVTDPRGALVCVWAPVCGD